MCRYNRFSAVMGVAKTRLRCIKLISVNEDTKTPKQDVQTRHQLKQFHASLSNRVACVPSFQELALKDLTAAALYIDRKEHELI